MRSATSALFIYATVLILAHLTLDIYVAHIAARLVCRAAMVIPTTIAISDIMRLRARRRSHASGDLWLERGGAAQLAAPVQAMLGSAQDGQ